MDWAVEAVADYVENVRPRFGFPDHPALWITERGGRLQPGSINDRFEAYRDALKLPKGLVPHSIRSDPQTPHEAWDWHECSRVPDSGDFGVVAA
ncbi:hypothetical protein [Kitasatospora sp. NPDC017646]|uniref:hypothetical protein n=1 Tax=Kitasatospora sp. NPDC017646 TaxID=3364024 RepID=UPI0037B5E1F8